MKKLLFLSILSFFSFSSFAQNQTAVFKVWGNCGMCKKTIEKAAQMPGVSAATWDVEEKSLKLVYDASTASPEKVQTSIAKAGYDTEKVKGDDSAYAKLHSCCKYERKESGDSAGAQIAQVSVQASGLTCAMCSNAVNEALKALSFVANVETDLETSSFIISLKPAEGMNFDAIRGAVEDAGFSVAALKAKASLKSVQVQNDAHIKVDGLNLHFLDVKPQELSGDHWITVVDKNFAAVKTVKKYAGATIMPCFETGYMASCCTGGTVGERIYHVTL